MARSPVSGSELRSKPLLSAIPPRTNPHADPFEPVHQLQAESQVVQPHRLQIFGGIRRRLFAVPHESVSKVFSFRLGKVFGEDSRRTIESPGGGQMPVCSQLTNREVPAKISMLSAYKTGKNVSGAAAPPGFQLEAGVQAQRDQRVKLFREGWPTAVFWSATPSQTQGSAPFGFAVRVDVAGPGSGALVTSRKHFP